MACGRTFTNICIRRCGLVLLSAVFAATQAFAADPIKADISVDVSGGFARLVFTMSDYDDASVRQAAGVLVISFKTPIDVSVDRLATQAPDYIGAARRDPDGQAVRLALARKVTVNAMMAGQQYYVDLLPDTWTGLPPGLPNKVVDELSQRLRVSEKLVERERRFITLEKIPAVHVQVATQPTFTRYIFQVPDQVSVAANRDKSGLTLNFDAPLRFDLGDIQATLPPTVGAITTQSQDASASVRFDLLGKVDVRTFRDENGFAVDVVGANAKPAGAQTPGPSMFQGATMQALPSLLTIPPLPAPKSTPSANAKAAPAAATNTEPKPSVAAPPVLAPQPVSRAAEPGAANKAALPPSSPAAPPTAPAVKQQPAQPVQRSGSAGGSAAPMSPTQSKNATAPKTAAPAAGAHAAMASPPPQPAAKPAASPPAAAQKPRKAVAAGGKIPVELVRDNDNLKLSFDFLAPTAAAIFNRADTLWLVFDSKADIDLSALKNEASHTIRSAEFTKAPDADIVRIKLDRPRLASAATDGPAWIMEIGDSIAAPTHALDLDRSMIGTNRSTVAIPLDAPHELHRITDPEAGDQLLVVTAFAPARGLLHTQNFIEFRALASDHGLAVEPLADDLNMALGPDKIVISRPGGLTLSSSLQALLRGNELHPLTFDPQLWGFDRKGSYEKRQSELIATAAAAPENRRLQPRLDLARFYLARSMYAEAEGVLNVALAGRRSDSENVTALVLRAVTEIMMNRPEAALKDLSDPAVGDQHDAPLWRALAYARQGNWGRARESFKTVETALATLPIELQRFALKEQLRASIETGDYANAENELDDLQTIGIPDSMKPAVAVLAGRLDEGLRRPEDALAAYRAAANSSDRPAAAQGRLRETELRYSLGDLKPAEVIASLESLTTVWRGDETEIEALQTLARLYTQEGRYRDSFYVMRSAMAAHPDWDMTRKIQQDAAKTFDSLFLTAKGDSMSPIDALALFYDFRELTPIGGRGDEMIRRLADRLVSVDLLDQAAGLLQYQVDNRLQGAARAEVATRLAVIYLMNRKPDKALAVLRASHSADLSNELREQRLLLEARALSDLGRQPVALEVIADLKGPVVTRLRSDIYWAAHEWDNSAEQIELLYGDRYKQWQPLTDVERSDILRAEIGYALAQDKLGLERFRDRYAAKMAGTPDAHAFALVSAPLGSAGEDFKAIARTAAAADTLDDFLRDMKARYPESNPVSSAQGADAAEAAPSGPLASTAASPGDNGTAPVGFVPPQTRPAESTAQPAAGPPPPAAPAATSSVTPPNDGLTASR